jgi:hypothetical protein
VQAENHALDKGKVFGKEGVEKGDEEHNGNGEESSMPSLKDIAGIVQDNETLNLRGGQKGPNGDSALPAKRLKTRSVVKSQMINDTTMEGRVGALEACDSPQPSQDFL